MKPVNFTGQNIVFAENQPEYTPLPAYIDEGPEGLVISCWELDEMERKQIAETGKIYLGMLTFHQPLQPIRGSILSPFPIKNEEPLKMLIKDKNHKHYWIDDDVLYETYSTLRGLRYRPILEVFGMPNCEKCTEEMIKYIKKEYL